MRSIGRAIDYSSTAKALGLTITSVGFGKHVGDRIGLARGQLRNLFRVINLSTAAKRLLYLASIRSVLVYPTIPLHLMSQNQQKKMQIVQNKAARIITRTRLLEQKRNSEVNRLANLEPIEEYLGRQAAAIWQKLELDEDTLARLEFRGAEKVKYPSSRRVAGVIA